MCQVANVPPPQPPVFGPGKAFACFGVYLCAQIVVGFAAMLPFAFRPRPTWLFPIAALGSLVASAVVLRVFLRALLGGPVRERGREMFGLFASSLPRNAGAALAGAGLAGLSLAVAPLLVPPPDRGGPLQEMAASSDFGMLVLVVIALVVAPPLEEFLFRGVMYHGLSRRLAPWLAALIVTVIFAALHVVVNLNYWPAVASITILAVLLIVLRMRYVSLAPALVAHFTFNAVMIAVAVATRA